MGHLEGAGSRHTACCARGKRVWQEPTAILWRPRLPPLSLPLKQVVAWYDNEWGYSQRVVDLAELTAAKWE